MNLRLNVSINLLLVWLVGTTVEAADTKARPEGIDGVSFRPVINGQSKSLRRELFLSYLSVQRAIRDERWKLIRYPQVNVTQLFDLQADPDEMHNLADEPSQRERVKAMLARLAELQPMWDDTAPLTVPNPKPAAWSPPVNS